MKRGGYCIVEHRCITAAFRTYAGETWDEAMARQAYPGCTTEWVRERWMKMEVV